MPQKTRDISIIASRGTFGFLKSFKGEKKDYDFSGIAALRQLLSNERARMLHLIKTKNPESIYHLAKLLNRDFKSVFDDIKLLDRFGFIDLIENHKGKRRKFKPVIAVDTINIHIKI